MTAKKSAAQLEWEIREALASPGGSRQRFVGRSSLSRSGSTRPRSSAVTDSSAAMRELREHPGPRRLSPKQSAKLPGARRLHATVRGRRKLGSIGDADPIAYGGGYIFSVPESGGPHLEYFEGLDSNERAERLSYDDDGEEKIDALKVQLYRVDLGKDAKDFLSDYNWVKWRDIASFTGQDLSEYSPGKLGSAQARARAAEDAASYHGWHEFDQYPLQLTVGELKARWGE